MSDGAAKLAVQPAGTAADRLKVAVAQALLADPGLLVLDEAWTGLDQAARFALDEAVVERLGQGGRVMFVDHDAQRLAGLVSER